LIKDLASVVAEHVVVEDDENPIAVVLAETTEIGIVKAVAIGMAKMEQRPLLIFINYIYIVSIDILSK
jgi:hypothetical protein